MSPVPWGVKELNDIMNRGYEGLADTPGHDIVRKVDEVELLAPESGGKFVEFFPRVFSRAQRDQVSARGQSGNPLLLAGLNKGREGQIVLIRQTRKQVVHIGPDTKIGYLPGIQSKADRLRHAAILLGFSFFGIRSRIDPVSGYPPSCFEVSPASDQPGWGARQCGSLGLYKLWRQDADRQRDP